MCMFCAAIPMSVAIGASVTAKQKERRRQAVLQGKRVSARPIPVGKAAVIVTGMLIVGSLVYHTVIMPRTGAFM